MKQQELIPHLFRTEFRKIVSVLCKHFGIEYIEMAEDIVGETFLLAMETWPYKGVPENPIGWLYTVAKNKTKNQIIRKQIFNDKVASHIKDSLLENQSIEIDLSSKNISDSQLQMLFAICHPSIATEAQISLSLRVLCGFGIDEIANAFLTSNDTINKRLYRAKEKLRLEKVKIEFPGIHEINNRLESVLTTLYLLFNEGYYSETQNAVLREDLCLEAMRLTYLLIENENTNLPNVNALLALMCFHASRFGARKEEPGTFILYENQKEALWDRELITKGVYYLKQSAQGTNFSRYHLEGAIAYWHTHKEDTKEKWENILQLYNNLLQIAYSPVAALNRTYALSKIKGKPVAIVEAEKLKLTDNHFYFTLLGELYRDVDNDKSKANFIKAFALAKTKIDKQTIQDKMDMLSQI